MNKKNLCLLLLPLLLTACSESVDTTVTPTTDTIIEIKQNSVTPNSTKNTPTTKETNKEVTPPVTETETKPVTEKKAENKPSARDSYAS